VIYGIKCCREVKKTKTGKLCIIATKSCLKYCDKFTWSFPTNSTATSVFYKYDDDYSLIISAGNKMEHQPGLKSICCLVLVSQRYVDDYVKL